MPTTDSPLFFYSFLKYSNFHIVYLYIMIRLLFWILAIYFFYRLIFHFIIPVFKVSQKMKQQVRDFRERQQEQNNQPSAATNHNSTSKVGEYIDFEEVKEN